MNCTTHPENAATAYCRTCGKAMCDQCKHTVHGVIYCEDCLANRVNQPAVAATYVPPPDAPSPALATLLGFIPGVGAMYNGQFYKGLIHVGIFAGLISLESAGLPNGIDALVGMSIGFWYIYMIVDANRTAHARVFGRPLPDPFGFERMFGGKTNPPEATGFAPVAPPAGTVVGFTPVPPPAPGVMPVQPGYVAPQAPEQCGPPIGAIVLIGLGVLFLLNQVGWFHLHWLGRAWPLILIGLGVWMFARRFGSGEPKPDQQQ